MVAAIEMRELISVAAGEIRLQGTYHRAPDQGSDSRPGWKGDNRIGILFLNSGFVPRAAGGDVAVYWADSFAKRGYPSFRFDLPGLGDSDGDLPMKRVNFAHLVNNGHYTPFVSTITKNLMERFSLSGVVLAGHCAGAVSAFYAAAASKCVKGVVALDPYFFLEEPARGDVRKELSQWVTQNRLAGQLGNLYGRVKKLSLLVKGNELPKNANLPLLRCWNHLASAGLPMLLLNAGPAGVRAGEFDYFAYLRASSGSESRALVKFIEGANHSFADNVGRVAVRQHTEQWLNACFPLVERDEIAFTEQLAVNHRR